VNSRTIAFRGFVSDFIPVKNDQDYLVFATDKRSMKVKEIQVQPQVSLCWYFPQTREQYRISGSATLWDESIKTEITLDSFKVSELRDAVWKSLSNKARAQFSWPQTGHPFDTNHVFATDVPEDSVQGKTDFVLLLIKVEGMDHLDIESFPNKRRYWQSGEWVRLNP
jgi:hypothetical protein